jgi:hypothetical protein
MDDLEDRQSTADDVSTLIASAVVVTVCLFPAYMADYQGWSYGDWTRIATVPPATIAVIATFAPIKRLVLTVFGRGNRDRSDTAFSGQQALPDFSGDGRSRSQAEIRQQAVRLIANRVDPSEKLSD